MKTTEAFTKMINTRGIHHALNMKVMTLNSLRTRLRQGTYISIDKMIELLIRAGYSIKTEMTWTDPAKSPSDKTQP